MQTTIEINRLKPLGTNILVKRKPEEDYRGRILIPEEYRDRNDLNGQLFCGVVIAAGDRTRAVRMGRERGWYDVGDTVWLWHMYDWKDHEIVLKDSASGDDYLVVKEQDVKAYEIMGK